jgi:hypothetical protein
MEHSELKGRGNHNADFKGVKESAHFGFPRVFWGRPFNRCRRGKSDKSAEPTRSDWGRIAVFCLKTVDAQQVVT